ncbi:MAG TPA: hypothetical protein VG099_03190 [Gemmataceae bacterium]|nr:hypothetical protein [Gemmataceae bacterium]
MKDLDRNRKDNAMSVSQWLQAIDTQPIPRFDLSRELPTFEEYVGGKGSAALKREGTLVPKGKHHESFKRCLGLLRDHLDIDIPGDADTSSAWGHLEKGLAKKYSQPVYDSDDNESEFEHASAAAISKEEGSLTMSLGAQLGHTSQAERETLAEMIQMSNRNRIGQAHGAR